MRYSFKIGRGYPPTTGRNGRPGHGIGHGRWILEEVKPFVVGISIITGDESMRDERGGSEEEGGARGDIREEGADVRAVGSMGGVGAECGAARGGEPDKKLGQGVGREGGDEHEQQSADSSLNYTVSDNLDVTIHLDEEWDHSFDDWSDDDFKTRLLATPHPCRDVTIRGSGGSSRTLIAEARLLVTPHPRGDVTRRGSGGSSRTLRAESGSPDSDDDEADDDEVEVGT